MEVTDASADIQKCAIKRHSLRIACEQSESAQEHRTALYKSNRTTRI